MDGVEKNCNDQAVVDAFLLKYNPYKEQGPLRSDLRGYAAYVKTHNLTADDISPELLAAISR